MAKDSRPSIGSVLPALQHYYDSVSTDFKSVTPDSVVPVGLKPIVEMRDRPQEEIEKMLNNTSLVQVTVILVPVFDVPKS